MWEKLKILPWEKCLGALALLALCLLAGRLILKLLRRVEGRVKMEKSLSRFLQQVIRALLLLLTGIIVAEYLGVPTASLVAVLSVCGLAVSLAVQGTLSNLAGGIQLLSSKPFVAGDYIEAGGVGGTVREVGLTYTHILTADCKLIYVPNSQIAGEKIVNFTREPARRIELSFSVSYDAGAQAVRRAVLDELAHWPQVLPEPMAEVVLTDYGASAVQYQLRFFVRTEEYWPVYFSANEAIRTALEKHGLEMTYDHLNVHLVPEKISIDTPDEGVL